MDINCIDDIKNEFKKNPQGFKLKVKVTANSKKNSIEFLKECDYIKIKITKPAVDGKANKELIDYLSQILNLSKNNISIISGEKSSLKYLHIKADAL